MSGPPDQHQNRKLEHVQLVREHGMQSLTNWMDEVILHPRAVPLVDASDIDLSCHLFGRRFSAPFLVSAMTGGHPATKQINEVLARACMKTGIPIGLGSQRVGLEDASMVDTYSVARDVSEDLFIIGNIGIGQLAKSPDPAAMARECVSMVGANALAIHFNKLQELVQPEGDKHFGDARTIVHAVARSVKVPVIVKEVGMGFSRVDCELLRELPVAGIDVGGLGGTNFSMVEAGRIREPRSTGAMTRNPGDVFKECGTPTPASVILASTLTSHPVIATGGMRTGLDVVKGLCLGASMAGFAYPMLVAIMNALDKGADPVENCTREMDTIIAEVRIAMALVNARTVSDLHPNAVHVTPALQRWIE